MPHLRVFTLPHLLALLGLMCKVGRVAGAEELVSAKRFGTYMQRILPQNFSSQKAQGSDFEGDAHVRALGDLFSGLFFALETKLENGVASDRSFIEEFESSWSLSRRLNSSGRTSRAGCDKDLETLLTSCVIGKYKKPKCCLFEDK
mmetsp:Transcript_29089/g.70959  ORF Transcript_29089/g.70959 Transcript_29089/m.70959 type:complete len:146 (+) Transcript_29089:240-677(+)|eukprot:CAMPEP_0114492306 /NCGR_PEP_ID=MMETSP0109-20121206/3480_1 /TAXON_ID=29199 /ORGANISM="Chlorarachnion reptans, Strain CCCM449" /LENGTH=145 /DNA_ID=CAMNT_0001669131 /DNA_START=191 /DNA_END=628 /DNA_ORIENTATION=+